MGCNAMRCRLGAAVLASLVAAFCGRASSLQVHAAEQLRVDSINGKVNITSESSEEWPKWDLRWGSWRHSSEDTRALLRIKFSEQEEESEEIADGNNESPIPGQRVAVVSKVALTELPYIASFVRHYSNIGVKTMYLLCKDSTICQEFRKYLRLNMKQHLYRQANDEGWTIKNNMNMHLGELVNSTQACLLEEEDLRKWNCLEEDYMLLIGPSEYLTLPTTTNSLSDFIVKHSRTELFRFRWIVVPYDELHGDGPSVPYRGFATSTARYMLHKTALPKIVLSEEPQCIGDDPADGISIRCSDFGPTLLNFQYRGLADCVLQDADAWIAARDQSFFLELGWQSKANLSTEKMKHLAWNVFAAGRLGPYIADERLLTIDTLMQRTLLATFGIEARDVLQSYTDFKNIISSQGAWEKFAFIADSPGEIPNMLSAANISELYEVSKGHELRPVATEIGEESLQGNEDSLAKDEGQSYLGPGNINIESWIPSRPRG